MPDKECCECTYWLPFDGHINFGYCRFNPPTIPNGTVDVTPPNGTQKNVTLCVWPVTEQSNYCAQFKQATVPAKTEYNESWG
jgi:hypothetical protein